MAKEELITKLPKKAPLWAVGFVAVISSLSATFVFVHNALAPGEVLAALLGLVKENTKEISDLSGQLVAEKGNTTDLGYRVNILEHDVIAAKDSLRDCEIKLARRKNCAKR